MCSRLGGRVAVALSALALVATACGTGSGGGSGSTTSSGDKIKVGILHSLSGTMAISEVSVKDAELLEISEINAKGGVLGKHLEPVVPEGAYDWPTFPEKAQRRVSQDKVPSVSGGWTSASRKAMLPVFERNKALLYYPVQYEGLESSPYIFYTGATTNQQIVPALDYLKSAGKSKVYLLGSDYVFPRTANKEIKAYAAGNAMQILGEEDKPLRDPDLATTLDQL